MIKISFNWDNWQYKLADFLFPPICVCCGKKGVSCCPDCLSLIHKLGERRCLKCHSLLRVEKGPVIICQQCALKSNLDFLASFYELGSVLKNILAEYKYHYCQSLSLILIKLWQVAFAQWWREDAWDPDNFVVVVVPLHRRRLRERGFNQSQIFAEALKKHWGIAQAEALIRIKDTHPLIDLSWEERQFMMRECFRVKEKKAPLIRGKNVIMLDDVITTGATMESGARVLADYEPRSIVGFSLAHGK